jgi:hypothetical protein
MFKILIFASFLFSFSIFAAPTLEGLMAQKRCKVVKGKTNTFDCMVDQSDGSVKKIRYFREVDLGKKKSKQ